MIDLMSICIIFKTFDLILKLFDSLAGLSKETIHSQLRTALDYVIHIERNIEGKRHVTAIGEFQTDSIGNCFVKKLNI